MLKELSSDTMRSSHGQPQCRRKATTTGLPPGRGNCNLSVDGALDPGVGALSSESAVGANHDLSSVVYDMVVDVEVTMRYGE